MSKLNPGYKILVFFKNDTEKHYFRNTYKGYLTPAMKTRLKKRIFNWLFKKYDQIASATLYNNATGALEMDWKEIKQNLTA
jgi:hypothetical protein